jgi:hypothetical protein
MYPAEMIGVLAFQTALHMFQTTSKYLDCPLFKNIRRLRP